MADQDQRRAEGGEVCNFFRKPSRSRANIRKRKADDASSFADAAGDAEEEEEEEEEEAPSALQHSDRPKKTLTAASNKLHFSSSKPASSKPSEANPDADEETRLFHFESSSEIQVQHDSRATAALETETEFSRDHRAIRERTLKQAEERLKANPNPNSSSSAADKIYKGVNSYTDYTAGFRREQTVAAEKAGGAHGPLRASAHIRTSARFDYQPDICKDYKETGYCGYGDSCKFMHDRGDYKSGWQMEREWDEAEKARKRNLAMGGGDGDDVDGGGGDEDDDDDDALPFACFICRQPFEDAVVTKCKHYFCEHCALKHHAKNKKCYVCNKPTLGIFNTAHEIRKKKAQDK